MKRILLILFVSFFCLKDINAQSIRKKDNRVRKLAQVKTECDWQNELANTTAQSKAGSKEKGTATSFKAAEAGAIKIGQSPHIFTQVNARCRVVDAKPELNMVSFIHRNNSNDFGGNSSMYKYDYSTDGGESFISDVGPLNENTPGTDTPNGQGRYPQGILYVPDGTAENAMMIYNGATHDGSAATNAVWDGFVAGSSKLTDISTTTQTDYLFPEGTVPTSLTEGLPGEFWTVDVSSNDAGEQEALVIYKGVWNGSDVEWALDKEVSNSTFDQSADAIMGEPVIAFSDDGMLGYCLMTGGLEADETNISMNPLFWMTEDGGKMWKGPHTMNLDKIGGYADTFAFFNNSVSSANPVAGPLSLSYDGTDIIVDKYGNLHVAGMLQSTFWDTATEDFSPFRTPAGSNFVVDLIYDKTANDWSMIYPDEVEAGAAFVVNYQDTIINDSGNGFIVESDVRFHLSKDAAGEKVFLTWGDDWDGLGLEENAHRDLIGYGYDIETGKTTDVRNLTGDNEEWYGEANFFSVAPKVLKSGSIYTLPTVFAEINNEFNAFETIQFWYYQEAIFEEGDFAFTPYASVAYAGILPVVGEMEVSEVDDVNYIFSVPDADATTLRSGEVTWCFGDGSDPMISDATAPVGHTFPEGIFTVEVCGDNEDGFVCTKKIVTTIDDNNAPTIEVSYEGTAIDDGGTVDIGSSSSDLESILDILVLDNVDPDPSYDISGNYNLSEPGSYEVTITATDASGNETTFTVTINVLDTEAPQIFISYNDEDYSDGDSFTVEGGLDIVLSELIDVNATDNSDDVSIDVEEEVDFTNVGGTYEIEITATDASGNSTTSIVSIEIVDTIEPEFDYQQGDYFEGTSTTCKEDGGFVIGPNDLGSLFTISDAFIPENASVADFVDFSGNIDEEAPGVYEIIYTADDGNGNKVDLPVTFEIKSECTGLQDYLLSQTISVYPNPTSGKFELQIANNTSDAVITVYNTKGKEMLLRKTRAISEVFDFSEFTSGIYYLQIIRSGAMTTKKIVVE